MSKLSQKNVDRLMSFLMFIAMVISCAIWVGVSALIAWLFKTHLNIIVALTSWGAVTFFTFVMCNIAKNNDLILIEGDVQDENQSDAENR